MMFSLAWLSAIALFSSSNTFVHGLKYTLSEVDYNLNVNKTATNPLDYSVEERSNYTLSPDNWRFPFYTVFLDRFVNGDPTNDNANETLFETDMRTTQIRNGGDLQGLVDSLDYIAGMGTKVIHGQEAQHLPPLSVSLLLSPSYTFALQLHVLTMGTGSLYRRLAFYQPAMGRRRIFSRSLTIRSPIAEPHARDSTR